MSDFQFALEHTDKGERFLLRADDDLILGYMTVERVHDEGIIIAHTVATPDTGIKGIGTRLFDGAIAWASEHNRYIVPVCPFVLGRFDKYPDKAQTRAVSRG